MNSYIAELVQTENKTVIKKIVDCLEKYGRVYVVGKLANDKAKTLTGDTVVVSDECNIVCCGIS